MYKTSHSADGPFFNIYKLKHVKDLIKKPQTSTSKISRRYESFGGDFLGLNFSTNQKFVKLNLRILTNYFKSGSSGCFNLLESNIRDRIKAL